jgi:hypothetical protein
MKSACEAGAIQQIDCQLQRSLGAGGYRNAAGRVVTTSLNISASQHGEELGAISPSPDAHSSDSPMKSYDSDICVICAIGGSHCVRNHPGRIYNA